MSKICDYCKEEDSNTLPCVRCNKKCCIECSISDVKGQRVCTDIDYTDGWDKKVYTRCATQSDYDGIKRLKF